jgi:hypothetical protein
MAGALVVVACGTDTPTVPQAVASPLTAASVALKQTGDAHVSIDQSSVHYRLDDARLIQITLTLHSQAPTAQSVSVLASLYEQSGRLIGDASGGVTNVAPNATTQVTLSGPNPNGTISSATFEVHLTESPTPAH